MALRILPLLPPPISLLATHRSWQGVSMRHASWQACQQTFQPVCCMQVVLIDTDQTSGLDAAVATATAAVGPPHNYSATDTGPQSSQLADISRPATAPAADAKAPEHAAAVSRPAQLTPEQVRVLSFEIFEPLATKFSRHSCS